MGNLLYFMDEDLENYCAALAGAVDLHSFEREHQDTPKPRIFLRKFERNGFVAGFDVSEEPYSKLWGIRRK